MSWKATAYVKELTEGISPSEKLLLFVLADYHNTAKSICWPSLPTLAHEALMSERQASRLLEQLEEKNLLRRIKQRGGHQTTLYQFVALDKPGGQNVIPEKNSRDDIGVTSDVTPERSRDDIRGDKSAHAIRKNGFEPVNTNRERNPQLNPTEVAIALCQTNGIVGFEERAKFTDAIKAEAEIAKRTDLPAVGEEIMRTWLKHRGTGKFPQSFGAFLANGLHHTHSNGSKPVNAVEEARRQLQEQQGKR